MPWKQPAGAEAQAVARRATLSMLAALGLLASALLLPPAIAQAQSQEEIEAALELYRYRLLQSGTRLRNSYPDEALRQRLDGDVQLELVVRADGTLRSVAILDSSGHALLDDTARQLVSRALPLTEIPSTLQNKAFAVRVTVVFRLPP